MERSERAGDPGHLPEASAGIEVELGALARNLGRLREAVGGGEIVPIVKADAYGHGAVRVSKRLVAEGVRRLAVARLREADSLRRAGIETEILILAPSRPDEIEAYRALALTPILSSLDQVRFWAQSGLEGHPVHLKVDTGMQRLGIDGDAVGRALEIVRASAAIELTGFCSHLAEGETPSSQRNAIQIDRFERAVARLTTGERSRALVHLGASGPALHLPAARYDAVRVGLALFGYDSAGLDSSLEPVMRVVARLLDIRSVPGGSRVGYGGTWMAPRDSRLGVLGIGYADGFPRALSNRGEVLVRGRRVPIVGAISMDLTLVDLTDVDVELHDECVLLGDQGDDRIDAVELAEATGTIPYVIICRLGAMRLPHWYRD